jgi:predicted transcriptional regulator of viral defense system
VTKNLRQRIGREEFDYPALMEALSEYANPRDRVTAMLRSGTVIRVKKGLYIFGRDLRRRPYSRELLANLVYGPSFVSLDTALSFYGLIPERVEAVTSVTSKRPKRFETPVGTFIYRGSPRRSFHLGMDRVEEGDVAFLIATRERALADKVRDQRGNPIRTKGAAARYLFDDLRIDEEEFRRLQPNSLDEIADGLRSRKVAVCASLLRKLRGEP